MKCTSCSADTRQLPVVVDDRLYRPCCIECVMADKWTAIALSSATPAELSGALTVDQDMCERSAEGGFLLVPRSTTVEDLSRHTALVQYASDVIKEHHGNRKRPDGCRGFES
jgi:hypothetical protein